jgi:hypothetical protein
LTEAADAAFPGTVWDHADDNRPVFLFKFRTENLRNGVAARVYVVDESNPGNPIVQQNRLVSQAKRGESFNSTWDSPGLTIEELEAYTRAGAALEYLIHENLTVSLP